MSLELSDLGAWLNCGQRAFWIGGRLGGLKKTRYQKGGGRNALGGTYTAAAGH